MPYPRDIYLVDAVRTPVGKYGGALSGVRPDDLAAHVVRELIARSPGLDPERIDDVVFGNANGAGEENRDVGRMAALLAGLPTSVPGVTVNRLCSSGLEAVIQAARAIAVGDASVVVAGGVESMSRAPWVMPKPDRAFPARGSELHSTTLGWRMVNPRMEPRWTIPLGESAELIADKHGISRERQDAFALASHEKAALAWEAGLFDAESVPVEGTGLKRDETIRATTSLQALAALRPSFREEGGTVTAGNSSPLNDGAAALLVTDEAGLAATGREPLARVRASAVTAIDPRYWARPRTGRTDRPGTGRAYVRGPADAGAERGVRRPGTGLPRRMARAGPGHGQPAWWRDRHRAPPGRVGRPDHRGRRAPARRRRDRYRRGRAVRGRGSGARAGPGALIRMPEVPEVPEVPEE